MGVVTHDLVLIGYNIGFKYYDESEWDKDNNLYDKYRLNGESESGDMVIIMDVMSGNYFIVGKLVSVNYANCDGLGVVVLDADNEKFKADKQEVKEFIKQIYGIDVEPTYIAMTHYT